MPSLINRQSKSLITSIVILCLLVAGIFPGAARANVPIMGGRVINENGTGVGFIHVKWEDASGGVRFAKTDADGYYSFASWSDYTADPNDAITVIPWETKEPNDLDEVKRLIDIWKLGSATGNPATHYKQEFVWYPPRTVNGVALPESSWSCLSNPNKFSVVVADIYNCDRVESDRNSNHVTECDEIFFDHAPYQKSEVCQLDVLQNQEERKTLPDFICRPRLTSDVRLTGTVRCQTPDGQFYPISNATVTSSGTNGTTNYSVQNGVYTTDIIETGNMIAARLSLPASFPVTVNGNLVTVQSAGTSILATNGCDTNFMNTNCSGINQERALQCGNQNNQPNSYEWCTLNNQSSPNTGFDFVVKNCVLPPTCDLGLVSNVQANFIFDETGPNTYVPQVVTWDQAVETPVKTDSFELKFYPAGGTVTTVYVDRDIADPEQDFHFRLVLNNADLDKIYDSLFFTGTDELVVEITPMEDGVAVPAMCAAKTWYEKTGTNTENTRQVVNMQVRETGNLTTCSGGTLPTALSGTLKANGDVVASDADITVPTASSLTSTYGFSSDLFSCNTCNPSDLPNGADKLCKKVFPKAPFVSTLYVSQQNITSWWEAVGGLAYGNSLGSSLPVTGSYPTLCIEDDGITVPRACAPYLLRSPLFELNRTAGIPHSGAFTASTDISRVTERVDNERASGLINANFQALKKKGTSAYEYYLSLIPADKRNDYLPPSLNTLPSLAGGKLAFVKVGDLKIDPSTAPLTVATGNKYIFFVTGNLTIDNSTGSLNQIITVTPGGFIAFFVKGQIIITANVGTDVSSLPKTPVGLGVGGSSATNAHVAGMFVADEPIIIQTNGFADQADKRFIGDGSFISAKDIILQRSFSRLAPGQELTKIISGYTPTEVFRHRPDIVLATPDELKEVTTQYQEVR